MRDVAAHPGTIDRMVGNKTSRETGHSNPQSYRTNESFSTKRSLSNPWGMPRPVYKPMYAPPQFSSRTVRSRYG